MTGDLGPWQPLSPTELVSTLEEVTTPWWLAGGWAIDAFLGHVTRPHADTDVLILRDDHLAVREALADWDAHAADPPGTLRPWPIGERLPATVHDVWLRPAPGEPWALQLMIDDTEQDEWLFRRDPCIRMPVSNLTASDVTGFGCHVLVPHVQLLYKSGRVRPKDELDFTAAAPHLDEQRRTWLRTALAQVSPNHPWLARL